MFEAACVPLSGVLAGGSGTFASASVLITAMIVPTCTTWPSSNIRCVIMPSAGEGISESTLSVAISSTDSSAFTLSPTFFSHLRMVASVTLSPILGITSCT
jgi:hypothetical protein